MVKLQHATRRLGAGDDGTILVGPRRYTLDATGAVEVAEADAAMMLQGANWSRAAGGGMVLHPTPAAAAVVPPRAVVPPSAAVEPVAVVEPAQQTDEDPDEGVNYDAMDLDALRAYAAKVGLNLPRASRLALITALKRAEE